MKGETNNNINIDESKDIKISADNWIFGYIKCLNILKQEPLEVEYKSDNYIYFVYGEKSPKFSIPPSNCSVWFKAGQTYTIEYSAEVEDGINATLYLIGYSNTEKIQTEAISPGNKKEITIKSECSSYRLAIRLSSGGKFKLKGIKIEEKINSVNNSSLINMAKKNSINNTSIQVSTINELKVAAIVDNFTKVNLTEEFNLITFTPENWHETLEKEKPHILFVESAWQGNDKAWIYKLGKYNVQDKAPLYELINYCNENNIPTVFWNKEDPIHFEKFVETAMLFDYIFTTDRNVISKYKESTKNDNVYELPFAAQPKLHNPIKNIERIDGVSFAGSYYGNRHIERRIDMEEVLDICKKYNLFIYDRNYEANKINPTSIMKFPDRFNDNIIGSIDYSEIYKAYEGYKVVLNVNSVKNSPTMFSRRVFECLACGTPVVSTYSVGISEMFEDIVICNETNSKIDEHLEKLFSDKLLWKQISLKGIREVMTKHTYGDRFRNILYKMNVIIEKDMPLISCFVFVDNMDELNMGVELFNKQIYENKELIIIMNSNFNGFIEAMKKYNNGNVRCFIGSYVSENYNSIKEVVNGKYLSYINIRNRYGENYLLDMVIATIYSEADVIGKGSYYYVNNEKINIFNEEKEYVYVDNLKYDRCIISKQILEKFNMKNLFKLFREIELVEQQLKAKVFSIDNNNFIENGQLYSNEETINKIFI